MNEVSVYSRLASAMPEDAIQRTKGSETRKGYNTTGFSYQYCVNRFNEVMGVGGWFYSYEIVHTIEGKYASGKPFFDITVDVKITLYVEGKKDTTMTMPGGHISASYADALKGAVTNGFKKCAAMFGVGRAAYEGSIDDDNVPLPADHGTSRIDKPDVREAQEKDAVLQEISAFFAKADRAIGIQVKLIVLKGKTKAQVTAMSLDALQYAYNEMIRYADMAEKDPNKFQEEYDMVKGVIDAKN
jgi:hypothetical protein